MSTVSYPHLEILAGQPARLKRLPRIRVAQIAMDYLTHGWSAEEMCRQHPHLRLAETLAALVYYFDHQQEVDEEIQREWEAVEEARSHAVRSPFYVRMHAQGRL